MERSRFTSRSARTKTDSRFIHFVDSVLLLRGQSVPEDILHFWIGHADKSVKDCYSQNEAAHRQAKEWAEKVGVEFLCSSRYAIEEARINLAEDVQRRRLLKLARQVHLFDAASRDFQQASPYPRRTFQFFLLLSRPERRTSLQATFGTLGCTSTSKSRAYRLCHQPTISKSTLE